MPENIESFSINALSTRLGYDRRSLSKWLSDAQPAGTEGGHPVYRLEDAQAAISKALQKGKRGSAARERLVNLQADKLAFQIATMRREYVLVVDVERDTGLMIADARRVLEQGPTALAPQVVCVTIPEAEQLLREWVQTALGELHNDPLGEKAVAPGASAEPPAGNFSVTEH